MIEAEKIDTIGLTLLHQGLVNICDEMAVSMMRTAYSPIFSEGLDFATLVLDAEGELMATSGLNPAMLGASLYAATWVIREMGAENFRKGDVWVHNDPYRGGSHMPEHMMIAPIFIDDQIKGYVGNIAHMAEIGGMAPGSFAATATEVYQEGLRLPPVRLFADGEPVRDLWRVILSNHRTPENSWGDLHAMLGSLRVGERRVAQLISERGAERTARDFELLKDLAERNIRSEILALPDGVYRGSDVFDDDGVTPGSHKIEVAMVVAGDRIVFDYTGSDPQAVGPINATFVVTLSASLNGLLYLIGRKIPVNAGINRAVRIVAPAGTICNVKHPGASVGGQTEYQPRVMEIISGLILSRIAPDRAAAASGNTSLNFLFGGYDDRSKEHFAHYHYEANGWGGRRVADGNNALIGPHANCRNTPVEIFETRWPWLHRQYTLRREAVGAGETRGGMGIVRDIEVISDTVTVSALSDRGVGKPFGILGGGDGASTRLLVQRAGTEHFVSFQEAFGLASATKFANVRLQRGDVVRLMSPSGGGYGDPLERHLDSVASDVADGFITARDALDLYGVVVTEDGNIDAVESRNVRAGRRKNGLG